MQTFHINTLYKLFFLFLCLNINSVIFAQDNVQRTMIVPVQAETITANANTITIKLNPEALEALNRLEKANYVVNLIPLGDCGQLRVKSKEKEQFDVELILTGSNPSLTSFSFDYIVFVLGVIKPVQIKVATSIFDE